MKKLLPLVTLVLGAALAALASPLRAQEAPHDHASHAGLPHEEESEPSATRTKRSEPWSERALELAGGLPVQEGGRVKPLSTLARFALLRMSGKKSLTTAEGEKLEPTAWLLDLFLAPDQAATYPTFLVQDSEAVRALGIDVADKKKRDRWSFDELRPGLPKLFQLAHEYSRIEAKDRDSVEQQIVLLAENVNAFLGIVRHDALAIVPPAKSVEAESEWWTSVELLAASRSGVALPESQTAMLRALGELQQKVGDPAGAEQALEELSAASLKLAEPRGEIGKLALESTYYRLGLLGWSLLLFVAAFLAAALFWLWPRSRVLHVLTSAGVAGATALLVGAITLRCMIRGRPPVSTLYETLLFVTAVGALVALVVEAINRRRVAVSTAAFLGMVGLFLANGYETLDAKDTMPSLVAVLDTNFWLATHVTAITIGYSAGMLAAFLASVYLLAKLVGIKRGERSWYASLGRMVYGVLAFSLIFSIVGTILGGIWANESWGRFWGWDPKENGALLICLTQIATLHGRMGGYLKEHGLCAAVAFGGTVIAFSWFGVNLLGVGLHSYGFTSGINKALWSYYLLQWIIVGLGGVAWLRQRAALRAPRPFEGTTPESRRAARAEGAPGSVEPA